MPKTYKSKGKKKSPKLPQVDDFFTKFIFKKKRALKKKIDKIKKYSSLNASDLSQEQLDLIEKKDSVTEQLKNFTNIETMYLTAHYENKKAESKTESQNNQDSNSKGVDLTEVSKNLANLLIVGNFFSNNGSETIAKKYGNGVKTISDLTNDILGNGSEDSNAEKIENSQNLINNVLSNSSLISGTSGDQFVTINELVNTIVGDSEFSSNKIENNKEVSVQNEEEKEDVKEEENTPEPKTEEPVAEKKVEESPQESEYEVKKPEEEIKLVKTSAKPSRKQSKAQRKVSEGVDEFGAEDSEEEEAETETLEKVVEKPKEEEKNTGGWKKVKTKEKKQRKFRGYNKGKGNYRKNYNNKDGDRRRNNYRGNNRREGGYRKNYKRPDGDRENRNRNHYKNRRKYSRDERDEENYHKHSDNNYNKEEAVKEKSEE